MHRSISATHAQLVFKKLQNDLESSSYPVMKRLGRTLENWSEEIQNYFKSQLTNARAKRFNNKAKLIKRRAYGYRSFENYRLRLLNACA